MPLQKRLFPSGIKLESVDLQAISTNLESALSEIVAAFASSGSSGENVLFSDTSATITYSGLQVNVPAQYFAVKGILAKFDGGSTLLGANNTYHLYFKLTESTTSASREKLIGGVAATATVAVESTYTVSLEKTVNPNVPVVNNKELRFATVVTGGSAVTSISFDPDAYLISFSGTITSNHAITHKPGGADAINLASSSNNTTGLMPPAYVKVVESAITDVTASAPLAMTLGAARSFTTAPGQNDTPASRSVALGISVEDLSFISSPKLTPRFQDSPIPGLLSNPGVSNLFARADHQHPASNTKFNAQLLVYVRGVMNSHESTAPFYAQGTFGIADLRVPWTPENASSWIQTSASDRIDALGTTFYTEAPITSEAELESFAAYYLPPLSLQWFVTAGNWQMTEELRALPRRIFAGYSTHAFMPAILANVSGYTLGWYDYVSGIKAAFDDNQRFSFMVPPALTFLNALEHGRFVQEYAQYPSKYISKPCFIEDGTTAVNDPSALGPGALPSVFSSGSIVNQVTAAPAGFARPINGWLLFKFVFNRQRPNI